MVIADTLISRLRKVKQTGDGRWIACCPAHDDGSPSLSITERDDRVLIHCFAGCPVDHVVAAVGLELSDLFPQDTITQRQNKRMYFPARDVLTCLGVEVSFLHLCASEMAQGNQLDAGDYDRMLICSERLRAAREIAR